MIRVVVYKIKKSYKISIIGNEIAYKRNISNKPEFLLTIFY